MILKHGGKVSAFSYKAKQRQPTWERICHTARHQAWADLHSTTALKPERGNVSKWGVTIKYELKTDPHHVKAYFRHISNPGTLTNAFGGKATVIFCFHA